MGGYIGVDNAARKISKGYIGVDGIARKIKAIYVGVNNVATLVWRSLKSMFIGKENSDSSGTIYESNDGTTFETNNTFTSALTGLNYVNDKYVASASDGYIYNSEDGKNWSKSNYVSSSIGEVEYGNDTYVVPANANGYYYSQDLINWTKASTTHTYDVAINEDNKVLQNCYDTSTGSVTCDTCGGSKTVACTGSFAVTGTGSGTTLCSCGSYSRDYTSTYYSCSTCGASYSTRYYPSGGTCPQCGESISAGTTIYGSKTHNSVTCSSCGGAGSTPTTYYYYYARLLNSPAGSQTASITGNNTFVKAYYYNGYFFAGSGNVVYKINPSDGSYTTSVPNSSGSSIIGFCSGNGRLVVVYSGSVGSCVSTDTGATWTQGSIGSNIYHCDVAFYDGKFYLVGYAGSTSQYFLVSEDGVNWTQTNSYSNGIKFICAPSE